MVGRSAFDTRNIIDIAKNNFGEQQLGLDLFTAASAIEIAAYDVVGQHLGTPIYNLLGGACHGKIPLYVNMYSKAPQSDSALIETVKTQQARGFSAAKLYPFNHGHTLAQAVATVAAVRAAVGPDFGLSVDLWRSMTKRDALAACTALSCFDLLWIEEPFDPAHRSSLHWLRDQVRPPLVAGETLAGKQDFHDLFSSNAVDWANPDVCVCGGFGEFRDIAALADVHHVQISPHSFGSMTIGLAATTHAAIGIPNLELTEYYPATENHLERFCPDPIVPVSGCIPRPEKPGLGVSLDTKALAPYLIK